MKTRGWNPAAAGVLVCIGSLLFCGAAAAATINGTVSDTAQAGLANMEVTLWQQGAKGWEKAATANTGGDGSYSFTAIGAGDYKVHARMAPGVSGNWGDEWYDVAAPTSGGLIFDDADTLTVADPDTLTGIDFELEVMGGIDGRALANTTPVADIAVRVESTTDHRIHHNDFTQRQCCSGNPHWGKFYMRGLPPGDYRALLYDFTGVYDLLVVSGPHTITSNANANIGDVTLPPMAVDPNEPNGASSMSTDITALPFTSSGAVIAPAGSDVDWYCIDALAGDRLIARVSTDVDIDGTLREHPWFDPIISIWDTTGPTMIIENDDASLAQSYEPEADSGLLPADGRYCVAVSAYGDIDWTGTGQQSTGHYTLEVELGNRAPSIELSYGGAPAPAPPGTIAVDEATLMDFALTYDDPDGDTLTVTVEHLDSQDVAVTSGTLNAGAYSGTYSWTPSETAAGASPYTLSFKVDDGEFVREVEAIIVVNAVNVPPTTPVLQAPANEASVDTATPTLTVDNSTDVDGDALSYEFELTYDDENGDAVTQAETVAEDSSGQTSYVATTIPENAVVSWRARAFDGDATSGYSPWSQPWTFMVDVANDAPEAPVVLKPEANEEVPVARPRISSTAPVDPEGDAVTVVFQVSEADSFDDIVAESDPVPTADTSETVEWTTSTNLRWNTLYYVRAQATDERGGQSAWSDVVAFSTRALDARDVPGFAGALGMECSGHVFDTTPESFVVGNLAADGDEIELHLQIFAADDDPYSATPLFETTVAQAEGSETTIGLDGLTLDDGAYKIRVRALRNDQPGDWAECDFFVGEPTSGGEDAGGTPDAGNGGNGGNGGDGDNGGGTTTGAEEGCGCGQASGAAAPLWLLVIALVATRLRRRREA